MSSSRLTTALIAAGSAVVAAVGVGAFASANNTTTTAEVCVGPNGQVRVADECRPSEERLTIQGEQGPKGDKGDQGDPGPQGDQGEPGTPGGVSGWNIVESDSIVPAGSQFGSTIAVCPVGQVTAGGGFKGDDRLAINSSFPGIIIGGGGGPQRSAWAVRAANVSDSDAQLEAYAICVDGSLAP